MPSPDELRPTHYTIADRFEDTVEGFDATVVVACDTPVKPNHWFTNKPHVITCGRCREFFLRPAGRTHRFLEGRPILGDRLVSPLLAESRARSEPP